MIATHEIHSREKNCRIVMATVGEERPDRLVLYLLRWAQNLILNGPVSLWALEIELFGPLDQSTRPILDLLFCGEKKKKNRK